MSKDSKPQRIIFQPTEENAKKLKEMAKNNEVSVSVMLNKILNEVDIKKKLSLDELNNGKYIEKIKLNNSYGYIDTMDAIIFYQEFRDSFEELAEDIKNNRLLPFSKATHDMEDYYDVILYDDDSEIDIQVGAILPYKTTIHPIVLNKLIDGFEHHDIISEWVNYMGCITFGVKVEKDENDEIVNYSIYGVFFDKTLFHMYMEPDDWDSDEATYEDDDEIIRVDCRKKGWHWVIENPYFNM